MGDLRIMSTELVAYVLLLSLPLWLLVEQLIHLRTGYRKERSKRAAKMPSQPLSQALRSGQK
jgi:hypothetical protein